MWTEHLQFQMRLRNASSWWALCTLRPCKWLVSYQSPMDLECPCNPGNANIVQTAHTWSLQSGLAGVLGQASVPQGPFTGRSPGSTCHLPNSKHSPTQMLIFHPRAELEESGLTSQGGSAQDGWGNPLIRATWEP